MERENLIKAAQRSEEKDAKVYIKMSEHKFTGRSKDKIRLPKAKYSLSPSKYRPEISCSKSKYSTTFWTSIESPFYSSYVRQ